MGASLIGRIFFIAGKPHLRLVSKELTEIRREKKDRKKNILQGNLQSKSRPRCTRQSFHQ